MPNRWQCRLLLGICAAAERVAAPGIVLQNEGDAVASGVIAAEKRAEREREILGQIDAIVGHDRAGLARRGRRQCEDVGRGIVGSQRPIPSRSR